MDYKKIFEALPHISEIWVKDEAFHLSETAGFKHITKDSLKEEKQGSLDLKPKHEQYKKH